MVVKKITVSYNQEVDRKLNVSFFTVSDSNFFIGTVALINSLRITEQQYNLVVLDAGLLSNQRRFLEQECRIVDLNGVKNTNPQLYKPFADTMNYCGVVVVIDSDVIITGSLKQIIKKAESGKICAFPDSDKKRFFKEWYNLFNLREPLHRQIYLNTAFVAFHTNHHSKLLNRWWELSSTIPAKLTRAFGASYNTPLTDGDQDAFNALLMSEVDRDSVYIIPAETGPQSPFNYPSLSEVNIINQDNLSCRFRNVDTILLHHAHKKPWQTPIFRNNAYSYLLPRLLQGDDIILKIPKKDIPSWLHMGLMWNLVRFILTSLRIVIELLRSIKWKMKSYFL